jgi:hypothetical protein
MSILRFAGVCCLVLGKWLICLMYGGADCPWYLMVGVNDLLYVALECFRITVINYSLRFLSSYFFVLCSDRIFPALMSWNA